MSSNNLPNWGRQDGDWFIFKYGSAVSVDEVVYVYCDDTPSLLYIQGFARLSSAERRIHSCLRIHLRYELSFIINIYDTWF